MQVRSITRPSKVMPKSVRKLAALGSYWNMRKTDKKLENQIRLALTDLCDTELQKFTGFQWLTHLVNYANFPKSLKVICVFDTNDHLSIFMEKKSNHESSALIQAKLLEIGISLKNISNHVAYDTEEDCEKKHNGQWAARLK